MAPVVEAIKINSNKIKNIMNYNYRQIKLIIVFWKVNFSFLYL